MIFKGYFAVARAVTMATVTMATAATASTASPLGTLESEGRFQVISPGNEYPVTISQPEYTFHSGDTVIARSSAAVLNFTDGGGLGFTRGSRITVVKAADGRIETEIHSGALLYSFPAGRDDFLFRVGNFSVRGQSPEVQSLQVSNRDTFDGTSVGTIERLRDGNLRATVRSGALQITNGDSVRYQVSAGESVGLIDRPEQQRTQATAPPPAEGRVPLILFQSPERVGTNEDFLIRWEAAEPVDDDYVVIAESGAEPDEFESLVSTDEGNELEFNAPGSPGDYEIRFIDGQTGEIKRFVYLDVVPDLIGAFWWRKNLILGGTVTVAATGVVIALGTRIADDVDPAPVSP